MPTNIQPNSHVQTSVHPGNISQSSVMDDKMALAVQLAKRDLKKHKEEKTIVEPINKNKPSSPKYARSKFQSKGKYLYSFKSEVSHFQVNKIEPLLRIKMDFLRNEKYDTLRTKRQILLSK